MEITQPARSPREILARGERMRPGPFGRRGRGRENGSRRPAERPRMTHSKTAAIGTAIAVIAALFLAGYMTGDHGVKRMAGAGARRHRRGVLGSTVGSGKPGIAATVAGIMAELFPGSGIGASLDQADRLYAPVCGKPRRRPVQAGCPPAGAIPVPAMQALLRRPAPTNRPAESTARNTNSPYPPAASPRQAHGNACRQPDRAWRVSN